jgi:hypothetical protein
MLRKLQWLYRLPLKPKILGFKMVFLLHAYTFMVWALPFKYLSRNMRQNNNHRLTALDQAQMKKVRLLNKVSEGIKKRWPWSFRCLAWTLAASQILRSARVPHDFYLGVKKNGNSIKAHSWIKSGNCFVTGHKPGGFDQVACFSFDP